MFASIGYICRDCHIIQTKLFLFVVKATALKKPISNFYAHILITEANKKAPTTNKQAMNLTFNPHQVYISQTVSGKQLSTKQYLWLNTSMC